MLYKIKSHFNKSYNLVFWILFAPAMTWTFLGIADLYINHFDELTKQHHMQFFLRFFFPLSLATLVTILDRRAKQQKEKLVKGLEDYLNRSRSIK